MIIFCEIESHKGYGFCETVGHEGNEEANDNEGHESSVHDGDTVDSGDDSGSLETRKQETKKKTWTIFGEQKDVVDQQNIFDQVFFGSN